MSKNFKLSNAVFSSLILLSTTGCNDKKVGQTDQSQRPVVAEKVKFEPKASLRSFVGVIRPHIESDLAFRVSGKVDQRLVQVGNTVKAGQELARLDPTDLHLQKQQVDAELNSALSSKTQANAAYTRGVSLRKRGWTTIADLDRLKAVSDEADSRVIRAQQAVYLANNALGYTTLLADSDGTVTSTMIEPGQVIASGAPAIRVAQSGAREVVVAIPESLVEAVSKFSAEVSFLNNSEKRYSTVLRELSPSADAATRTYQAKFTLNNASPNVEIGMTATLYLNDAGSEKIAKLPLSSLFNQGKGASLWVIDTKTGNISLKSVEVAGYEAESVLIRSGVETGDMIVTLGVQKLDAGQKVKIVTGVF